MKKCVESLVSSALVRELFEICEFKNLVEQVSTGFRSGVSGGIWKRACVHAAPAERSFLNILISSQ